MQNNLYNYRFQKCTDVDKELPIYELIDESNAILLDISMDDDTKSIHVLFHHDIVKQEMHLDTLRMIIDEGERLIINEQ